MTSNETLHALRKGELVGARDVRLSGLSEFPSELYGLADTLEILDLGGGALTSLPQDFGRFRKLRVLFASGNAFECMPPALADCPLLSQISFRNVGMRDIPEEALPKALRWLILTDNQLQMLPRSLGERPRLQKLMLTGNRLRSLPATLANASNLELIRLSANEFDELPGWLAEAPRLAWVAWSGNPVERRLASGGLPAVSWRDLEIEGVLGEGASGRIHQARWRHEPGGERSVALKLFRGLLTSDGKPENEIAAMEAVGPHPSLLTALGRVSDAPDRASALVLPLVPGSWVPLAGPPDMETCSRDVYAPAFRPAFASVLTIVRGIVSAVAHMHRRGLLHGDVYAHNILWDGAGGGAVLGDFGAASALPAGAGGNIWKKVEVRALGVLLDELLARCEAPPAAAAGLRAIRDACLRAAVSERPDAEEALQALDRISDTKG